MRTLVGVMRLLLSPKWMAWHVLTLGAMVTCGFLAVWQWGRAGSAMGSALNIGYGLQWPLFAIFFGVMWWRFLRLEVAGLREQEAGGDEPPADGHGGTVTAPATTTTTATTATAAEPELSGVPAQPAAPVAAGVPAAAAATAETAATSSGRPSPFTARPAGVSAPRATDPQLRAYNEELARLAARQEETSS
ncbi:hypothetical protein SAMN05216207_100998 [Pseudonocardia ammonioxydans]|uniref:DNA-binding transcriptional regulator of glucitol operon n=2 Tax=Pseudonocardia ammonioxydans TaxID=260086 RepID=A0A1I4WVB3_PSUAM|nr:hypothetical protein SAMN05216207_100998 [Pseudonocardia ammonioxydans]